MKKHERARAWRKRRNLTIDKLAELTGYGPRAIMWFEKGLSPPNRQQKSHPVPAWIWHRYRRICHGVEALLVSGEEFDW